MNRTPNRPPRPEGAKPWIVWDRFQQAWVEDPIGDLFHWHIDENGDAHPVAIMTIRCHYQISPEERCKNMYKCYQHGEHDHGWATP